MGLGFTHTSLEVESAQVSRGLYDSNEARVQDRFSIAPVVGFEIDGSYLHPNFIEFDMQGEWGGQWESIRTTNIPLEGDSHSNDSQNFLQDYAFNLAILKKKPYATQMFISKNRMFSDRDFFSRVRVNAQNLGFSTGYRAGPVPWGIRFLKTNETEEGSLRTRGRDETRWSFDARNKRTAGGQTELSFSLLDYERVTHGLFADRGNQKMLTLTNTEQFGSDDQIRLRNSVRYHDLQHTVRNSDNLSFVNRLTVDHTQNLNSQYAYDLRKFNVNGNDNETQTARASLEHQLFESLTSSGAINFFSNDATADELLSDTTRIRGEVNEAYTKRLGKSARLYLNYGVHYEEEERLRQGSYLSVDEESHTLNAGEIAFLKQPFAEASTLLVTDDSGSMVYQENIDYIVIDHGDLLEIRRITGGAISENSEVLISYRADEREAGSFSTLSKNSSFRIELFERFISIYGRRNQSDNTGGEDLLFRDRDQKVLGVDFNWNAIKLKGERKDYQSNITPYETERAELSYSIRPHQRLKLGINFSKDWTTFIEDNRFREYSRITGSAQIRFNRYLSMSLDGGIQDQQGDFVDQDINYARARLSLEMLQLKVDVNYEYRNEKFSTSFFQKNELYMEARRRF